MSTLQKPAHGFHHGHLTSSLIEAGLRQVDMQGLNSLGLRQLALATGVSPTAVYRHFADLEHLKAAVSQASRQSLGAMMLEWMAKVSSEHSKELAVCRMWAAGSAYIEFGLTKPNRFEIAFIKFNAPTLPVDDPNPYGILISCLDDLHSVGLLTDEKRAIAPTVAWSAVHGFAGLASQGFTGSKKATRASASDVLTSVSVSLGFAN
jgi:AcrR family transcriptional regulator